MPMHIPERPSAMAAILLFVLAPCARAAVPALADDATCFDATAQVESAQSAAGTGQAGSLGPGIDPARLAALRGGDGGIDDFNLVDVDGSVDGNTAHHVVSGANTVGDSAFANASGINTVIQNTGSNVLIQNAMIVTVDFVDPVP